MKPGSWGFRLRSTALVIALLLLPQTLSVPSPATSSSRPRPPFPPDIQRGSSSEDSRVIPGRQEGGDGTNSSISTQLCGTAPPSTLIRAISSRYNGANRLQSRGLHDEADALLESHGIRKRLASNVLYINTYFHFVTTVDQARFFTSTMRKALTTNQAAAMNLAFRPANITFRIMTPSFTIKNDWATDANSGSMKSALRKGTYADLNIYFQSNLSSSPGSTNAPTLLGYCTLPTTITYTYNGQQYQYPAEDYAPDGCNILAASMPGAPLSVYGYDRGKTAVHEVGHWFGLLHTFQDQTCDSTDNGDYISDTPQESTSTVGCPVGKDSCPNSPGLDPINNYMDYSTDQCYTGFTPLQRQRMQDMFNNFRKGY